MRSPFRRYDEIGWGLLLLGGLVAWDLGFRGWIVLGVVLVAVEIVCSNAE